METAKKENIINSILANCNDKKVGRADIKALIKAVEEENEAKNVVKPTELDIPVESVVKRYKVSEAMEIVRTKTAIFFHSTCFWVVSKPTLANNGRGGALYEMLEWYCDYRDEREAGMYQGDNADLNDTVCQMIEQLLTLPLDVFTDLEFTIDIATAITEKRTAYYTRLMEMASVPREETAEDEIKNQEFEMAVRTSEQLVKEMDVLAKKKNNGKNN